MAKMVKVLAALVLFVLVITSNAEESGLVGWWSFDEGEGVTVKDKSSYVNEGTLKSKDGAELPTWIEGKFGSALQFKTQSYVCVPDSESISLTNALTIEAWVKMNWSKIPARTIVNKGGAGPKTYYWFRYAANWSQWVFEFGDGKEMGQISYTHTPTPDRWYHLAVTFDKGKLALYLDGVQVGTATSKVTRIVTSANSDLSIGSYGGWGHCLNGAIDELRILNRALTPEEIKKDALGKE